MSLKLSSLFSKILNWPQETQKKTRPAHSRRRLMAERLESRYALTGDIVPPDTLPPDPSANPDPPADVAPPVTDPAATGTGDPTTGGGAATPPNSVNQSPIISDFNFILDGNWVTIDGLVNDDQDPTGYIVSIWGIVNSTVTVTENHRFTLRFAISPDYTGSIFAQTQDALGLISNTAALSI